MMKLARGVITALCLLASALAQDTIKKDVESAIVWSGSQCQKSDYERLCGGLPTVHSEASSLVQDPLTGNSLRKISYEGIDVVSGLRSYDVGCGWNECHTVYAASFTIVNNTEYPLVVDGKTFTSTLPGATEKEIRKWWGKKANLADFVISSGVIQPRQSMRIIGYMVGSGNTSPVVTWLNNASVFVIPLRYSIKLRGKDFVFPWLAPVLRNFAEVPQWDY